MSRGYFRNLLSFYEDKSFRKEQRSEVRELAYVWSLPRQEFIENFKVSPEMVNYLCEELHTELAPRTSEGLPVYVKVLTALRILTNGHYQRGNGQEQNTSIAPTTVSKYLSQFLAAVNAKLKPSWIVFPGNEQARHQVSSGFEQKFGIPNVLGAIDCTHVTLFPPPGVEKIQYKNRHEDMSINVQLVCDADCRILNCNANYPGRVHDQFIFNSIQIIKEEMRRLYSQRVGDYYLLVDIVCNENKHNKWTNFQEILAMYALEPWLMTPFRNTESGSPEARYDTWHCRARNTIERTNGYLKGTFRMLGLDRNIHYEPEKASSMIYAACTLYNIMKYYRVPMEPVELPAEPVQRIIGAENQRMLDIALTKRRNIVENYFN